MQRIASLTLVAGAALLLTWVIALATPQPVYSNGAPRSGDAVQAAEPLLDAVVGQVTRLSARLDRAPSFARPARDPFRFVAPSQPPPSIAPPPDAVPAPPVVLPRLLAILSDRAGDTQVHRAALSINGAARIVGVGETVGALRVERVDADGVDLVDPVSRAVVRLTLR
jgi:hypothetical protein